MKITVIGGYGVFGGRLVRNDLSFHLLGSGAEVDQPKNKTTVLNPDVYVLSVYSLTLEEMNNPE